jgi:hypothetical protein
VDSGNGALNLSRDGESEAANTSHQHQFAVNENSEVADRRKNGRRYNSEAQTCQGDPGTVYIGLSEIGKLFYSHRRLHETSASPRNRVVRVLSRAKILEMCSRSWPPTVAKPAVNPSFNRVVAETGQLSSVGITATPVAPSMERETEI